MVLPGQRRLACTPLYREIRHRIKRPRYHSHTHTMIQRAVDFALRNRFLVLAMAVVLILWGAYSFHTLPVEAYPDVADTYVNIITQWPGRAAEEVEQQVTIPIETQ